MRTDATNQPIALNYFSIYLFVSWHCYIGTQDRGTNPIPCQNGYSFFMHCSFSVIVD